MHGRKWKVSKRGSHHILMIISESLLPKTAESACHFKQQPNDLSMSIKPAFDIDVQFILCFFFIISSKWCRTWICGEQRRSSHQKHSSRCNVKTIRVTRRLAAMKHVARETCDWCESEAWSSSRLQAFIVCCDACYFIGGLFPFRFIPNTHTHMRFERQTGKV